MLTGFDLEPHESEGERISQSQQAALSPNIQHPISLKKKVIKLCLLGEK
jgi:hypothetical protein